MHEEQKNAEYSYIGNLEANYSIEMVMPANMIEENHQHGRASQEIEICGVTARAIWHLASL